MDGNNEAGYYSYDHIEYVDEARMYLGFLTEEERVNLFNEYCKHCGSDDPKCVCWREE